MSTPSFISDKYVWEGWCDLFICGWVKPFGWAWCHVGAPRGRAGGGGPLVQCLPSNAGRGGHKTSSHSFPSPQETPWQLGQKNKQKMGPPHHSWHALASPVKCLKSFTSVFFRDNWASFNVEHAPPLSLHLIYPPPHLFFPCSPLTEGWSPRLW